MLQTKPVTARSLADDTGLNLHTCYKLLRDPEGQYKDTTAEVVTQWFRNKFDSEVTVGQLFHGGNLRDAGRDPLSGTPLTVKRPRRRAVICGECFQENPVLLTECDNCGEPLDIAP